MQNVMKCRIQACKLPVDQTLIFNPSTMKEPESDNPDICINQDGFHDHKTNTWYKFIPARVSSNRFKNRV